MEWSAEHGRALRDRRQRQGLSQEQLAELAGLATGTVKNLERGARTPRPSTLQLLADALRCTCHDLLDKRVHPPSAPRAVAPLDASYSQASPIPARAPEVEETPDLVVLERPGRSRSTSRFSRLAIAGAVATALAAGGIAVWWSGQRPARLDPGVVAVAVFENRTGDPSLDPMAGQASDWIAQNLSESGLARATTGTRLLVSSSVNGSSKRSVDDEREKNLRTLARTFGAGVVVSGFYRVDGDSLRVNAWIDDARQDEVVYAVPPAVGPRTEPWVVIQRASSCILGALAAHYDHLVPSPRVAPPPTFEAYLEFRAASNCYRDWLGGRYEPELLERAFHHLQRSVDLDSTFVKPLFSMFYFHRYVTEDFAAADSCLGFINSRQESQSPWFAAWTDACAGHAICNYNKALRGYRRMAEIDPSDVYTQYWLAISATAVNRYEEALEALDRIDDDAMRDLIIGRNALLFRNLCNHALGRYQAELESVELLRDRFPGDWFSYSRDYIRPLVALGRLDEFRQAIDQFMAGCQHSIYDTCLMLEYAVDLLRAFGYESEATAIADRVVSYCQNRPAGEIETVTWRAAMARSLYAARRWNEAYELYEELAEEDPDELLYVGRLGTLAARRGDRVAAERILNELRGLERPYLFGKHTIWCARITAVLGDREQAVQLLREALGEGAYFDALPLRLHPCSDLEPLYGYEPYEELRRPKG